MIDWLIGTLTATSLLIVLVLFLREPVRRRFGAQVAYALWLIPAARMAMPSLVKTVERIVPDDSFFDLPMTPALPDSVAPGPASAPLDSIAWPQVLIALWLIGAGLMLLRGLVIYRAQRRAILHDAIQLARLGDIRIVRSEAVRGPVAFGLRDKVIALPFDFDDRFSECERRLALDHELAHHRSGDLVANLIAFVLLCLQWFNPLAWAAHAAFRFDQEAACDARVLDKVGSGDRGSYGNAIAKAASGRTLLFAGALDRPSSLSRRLTIMTLDSSSRSRRLGFALLGGALLFALPTTASRAIDYVDVKGPSLPPPPSATAVPAEIALPVAASAPAAPPASVAKLAAVAQVAPVAQVAQVAPVAGPRVTIDGESYDSVHQPDIDFIGNDTVRLHGVTKRWNQLTPSERSEIRAETANARIQIQRELDRLPQEMARVNEETLRLRKGEFQREMAQARAEIQRSMAEVERTKGSLRSAGIDPERIKADLRRSLADVDPAKIAQTVRESLASVNPEAIRAQVMGASKSLDDVDAKLNQLDGGQ